MCQLHANELPLRHLLHKLDGKTSDPTTFTGPIGKQLYNAHKLPILNFVAIPSNLPDLNEIALSTDQNYLYHMVNYLYHMVSVGKCSSSLTNKSPGNISHARWLTTANNTLRLYVSASNASSEIVSLPSYICTVYAPTWFQINCNSNA